MYDMVLNNENMLRLDSENIHVNDMFEHVT